MQTKLMHRSSHRGMLLLAAAIVTSLLPGSAHALGATCYLSGQGNSFQAYQVQGPSLVDISFSIPLHEDVAGQDNYYSAYGLLIFDTAGDIKAYYHHGTGAQRPRVLVANGSQTLIDVGGVTVSRVGLPYAQERWISIPPGAHYIVGFSFGSAQYSASVSFNAVPTCIPLNPGATLVQKDQTDFTAPGGSLPTNGQVYAIAAGVGSNLKLSVPNPRRFSSGTCTSTRR